MNIVIFGATGPSGRLLVEQALEQDHQVTAFVRTPSRLGLVHPRLVVAQGDILDAAAVDRVIQSRDAVLSALGVKIIGKNTVLSDGTRNIMTAMQRHNVRRFICETSLGVGDSRGQMSWIFEKIILPTYLRNIFADKEIQERDVMASNLDWTILRPAMLSNGPLTGVYQVWVGKPPGKIRRVISRADVADFFLKELRDHQHIHAAVGLSY